MFPVEKVLHMYIYNIFLRYELFKLVFIGHTRAHLVWGGVGWDSIPWLSALPSDSNPDLVS